jgi:20S proteasome alpha/beta subunit
MTIALGMACHKGIIVAADTQITTGVSIHRDSKLQTFIGKSLVGALVYASDDINATKTLVRTIERTLRNQECADTLKLEELICGDMTAWRSAYAGTAPAMQLILAVRIKGDGARLFFCEPPNTFLENREGYVAAGTGADVTDSLHDTLFGLSDDMTEVQAALRRMSYLMYRAKKDNLFCGKTTHCAIVSWDCPEAIIVNHLDIAAAERISTELDFLLHTASTLLLSSTDETIKKNAEAVGKMMEGHKGVRISTFHDLGQNVITL